jgi:Fe-S-cluster containining protein
MLVCDRDIPPRLVADDRWGGQVMRRLDDGWCAALDRASMRCTIYEDRPDICRDFAMGDSDCASVRASYYRPSANLEPS